MWYNRNIVPVLIICRCSWSICCACVFMSAKTILLHFYVNSDWCMRGSSSDVLKRCPAFFATSLTNFASPLHRRPPSFTTKGKKSNVSGAYPLCFHAWLLTWVDRAEMVVKSSKNVCYYSESDCLNTKSSLRLFSFKPSGSMTAVMFVWLHFWDLLCCSIMPLSSATHHQMPVIFLQYNVASAFADVHSVWVFDLLLFAVLTLLQRAHNIAWVWFEVRRSKEFFIALGMLLWIMKTRNDLMPVFVSWSDDFGISPEMDKNLQY